MRWIDFDALKAMVPMRDVLFLIGWTPTVHRGGGQYRGRCPLHKTEDPRSVAFAVKDDGFTCHKCKEHGDQVRLYALWRKLTMVQAAVELCRELHLVVPRVPH